MLLICWFRKIPPCQPQSGEDNGKFCETTKKRSEAYQKNNYRALIIFFLKPVNQQVLVLKPAKVPKPFS